MSYCYELADDPQPQPRPLTRRFVLLGCAGMAGTAAIAQVRPNWGAVHLPDDESRDDWRAFAARFVASDGRVVDTGNGGVTHTEGQGYALLFSEHFDDRAMFDNVLSWTRRNLRRSGDMLHAWQYRPNDAVAVPDYNNATDGDLMIAWALLRAGARWGEARYTDLGRTIGGDLLRWCTREVAGVTVLLPGTQGFEHDGRVVINPSYYVFPALAALSEAVPDPRWDKLREDGLRLLRAACFGRRRLPADWLEICHGNFDTLAPAKGWPARFSWDAVRVPLNLVWASLADDAAIDGVAAFWENWPEGQAPAWVSLTDDTLSQIPASHGVTAIAQVLSAARASGAGRAPVLLQVGDAEDYYSAALTLLARVAWCESRDRVAST